MKSLEMTGESLFAWILKFKSSMLRAEETEFVEENFRAISEGKCGCAEFSS